MGLWGPVTTVTCLAHRPFIVSEMAKIKMLGYRYNYVPVLMTWGILVASVSPETLMCCRESSTYLLLVNQQVQVFCPHSTRW